MYCYYMLEMQLFVLIYFLNEAHHLSLSHPNLIVNRMISFDYKLYNTYEINT